MQIQTNANAKCKTNANARLPYLGPTRSSSKKNPLDRVVSDKRRHGPTDESGRKL